MAKKTKDGLIMQGFRSLANRFSPEAEKYARYKIQKQKGTYDDKTPSYPEPVYRGPTEQEKKNMKKGFDTPKDSKPTKPRKTQKVSSSIKSVKSPKKQTLGENSKLKKSKATAAKLKDLGLKSTAKKESKKQLSNKERRQQNRAANLALRTGKTLDEASALKEKRRNDRKQYLRNFASQLARGEQAAPIKGFGEGEDGKPGTGSSLVDNSGAKEEVAAKTEQANQDTKSIQKSIDTFGTPNSSIGLGVTPMGGVGQNFGIDLNFNTPDLTASKYMQQEYLRKKLGK